MWKQFQQFLMSSLFVIGHSGDDIIQIIPWVYIMCLTGGQQGTVQKTEQTVTAKTAMLLQF